MSNSLLNISGKLDSESIALFDHIGTITTQLNIPYVVVGAYALSVERLIEKMCDHHELEYDKNEKLTNAMIAEYLS